MFLNIIKFIRCKIFNNHKLDIEEIVEKEKVSFYHCFCGKNRYTHIHQNKS